MILIILGLVVWGSTLTFFLIKTYGGDAEKAKTPWPFFISSQNAWDVWHGSVVYGRFQKKCVGQTQFKAKRTGPSASGLPRPTRAKISQKKWSPKPIRKPCPNHMILIILGLVVWGSTLATFLIKTYGGNPEKAKTPWAFFISSQNAWGVWHGSVVYGKFLNKTRGPNAIQSKTHWAFCIWTATAYQSKDFSKKIEVQNLLKNHT